MEDKKVGLSNSLAWGSWAVATALFITGLARPEHGVGNCGVLFAGAAVTLHVRSFLCTFVIADRDAFELGREAGRREAANVPLQRVQ